MHLADGRQDQKNRPVAEIRPADHLLNPVQEDRARRFKQYLLVVAVELPDREAAAAREPTQRVGEPNRQAGEIIECEQVTVIGCNHQLALLARSPKKGSERCFRECTHPDDCELLPNQ